MKTKILVKRIVKSYLLPHKNRIALAVFFMTIAALMTAAFAKLMQPIIDDVLTAGNKDMIVPVAIGTITVFVLRGFSGYLHTVIMHRVSLYIVADIQKDMFSRMMDMDLTFFHGRTSGELISRIVGDVTVMRNAITETLTGFGKSILTLVLLVGVMFWQDWKLSLIAFTIFPFAGFFVARLGKRMRRLSGRTQEAQAELTDILSQIFHGVRQVKAYGMEDFERNRAGNFVLTLRDILVKTIRVSTLATPVNEILSGLVVCCIIIYGGYQVMEGHTTAGQLLSFITAFLLAYEPMKQLAKLNNKFQVGLGAAERVFETIDTLAFVRDCDDAKILSIRKAPEIRFQTVTFAYEGEENAALHDINLTIPKGQTVALVGPSGGGKSTVMNLIPRFYDVGSGRVLINGQDIRTLSQKSLREHIALVSQEISIFNDTIEANIGYGREGASLDDIKAAAKAAAADDFIEKMPEGYDTVVGENGVKLSGGQRQRLSIARAILRDAPILLLDEATSALDTESERAVQAALENLKAGRTTLVIAHRLSTIRDADRIVVLDAGCVVEEGAHADLLAEDGLYAKMHRENTI